MRLLDLFELPLSMAEMKSVLVATTGGSALSPEILSVIAFAALAGELQRYRFRWNHQPADAFVIASAAKQSTCLHRACWWIASLRSQLRGCEFRP
jgi:hypothetical protein